jgi:hypothetical protein
MERTLLTKKMNRIEILENNISFYKSIKATPEKLINRAIEELEEEWEFVRALIALRHHYRNKNVQGKNWKRAINLANLLNDIYKKEMKQ